MFDISVVKERIKTFLLSTEKSRVRKILRDYGYLSLGDLELYASKGDEEAQAILKWYLVYDDKLWAWIENVLENLNEDGMKIDPLDIEANIYAETKTLLPPEDVEREKENLDENREPPPSPSPQSLKG
jgi:hypothetical protein